MNIDTEHEIVGKKNSELDDYELGSSYPVLDSDNETITGVFCAEYGSPEGYILSEKLQAYIKH